MSAAPWEPVASYWCIVLRGGMSIPVDERTAREALDMRIGNSYPHECRDIHGSAFLLMPSEIAFIHENTPEHRERIRAQEDMHRKEAGDEDDETLREPWRRG